MATHKRKRDSAPISPPSDGRTARRVRGNGGGASVAAAAEHEERPTIVDVESVECDWATALRAPREAGQFIDITLLAGGRRIEAHKVVLVGLSRYLKGLLTSGLAESVAQSQELTLEDMDGRAVEAVVDCMYSGKLALSPRSVTAVLRVANLLQVGAVEKAAGAFFVSKLEPSTAADALGFAAERVECGEHAAALHDKCVEYVVDHFVAVSRKASFLSLPRQTVASLIASDELPVEELDVVSAVRSWFEHDAEGRKASLKTLVPLVRWPLLPVEARKALNAEPLLKQLMTLDDESRGLAAQMLLEFDRELRGENCPRLKQRKGATLPLLTLAFSTFSAAHYRTSEEGALIEASANAADRPAMCGGHVMNSGKSCAEFTILHTEQNSMIIGLARPTLDENQSRAWHSRDFWGLLSSSGRLIHNEEATDWDGQQGYRQGDVLRLLLDSDAGTLTVKKNGTLLGVAVASGLTGDLCWAMSSCSANPAHQGRETLRIKAVDPREFLT
eukprot:COSAG02_NODE_43_length_45989_cov_93.430181_46_plen_503_part_00